MGRKEQARRTFIQSGVSLPTAEKLSSVVETTAQRRGRVEIPDVLAVVCNPGYFLEEGTCKKEQNIFAPSPPFPPPPPQPPKVKVQCRVDEMYDEGSDSCRPRTVPGLGCFQFAPKQSIARGVSYSPCPGMPGFVYASDFNEQSNLTSQRFFGDQINTNSAALKKAGYKAPPSEYSLSSLTYQIGKAQQVAIKTCGTKAVYQNSSSCLGARNSVARLQKEKSDLQQGPFGWF